MGCVKFWKAGDKKAPDSNQTLTKNFQFNYNTKGAKMEAFIISVLTSLIVTYTMMHYHIYKVNELYKKYMDFETSSVKKFAEDIISKLPKNSSPEE